MTFSIGVESSIDQSSITNWDEHVSLGVSSMKKIYDGTGAGADFLGWVDLPEKVMESGIIDEINDVSKAIQKNSKVMACVGIGGSYLGARAVIDSFKSIYHDFSLLSGQEKGTMIRFAGHHLSGNELEQLLQFLKSQSFSINIISKSGTTTEPGIAFRILRQLAKSKYKKEYHTRIIATTDKERGALKKMAQKENYKCFDIPDDVGGRYSVFTPVGLLPIAVAGIDIHELISGAFEAQKFLRETESVSNPALLYATLRYYLYQAGKSTEVLVSYMPETNMIGEWWKQLFGESEGKEGKSLWPSSVQFTTDLHSVGQWLQEGPGNFFETILDWEEADHLSVPLDEDNLDGLNYLQGKSLAYINQKANQATQEAHLKGGAEIIKISPGKLTVRNLGELLYFFETSCAISGYMLGVNPFNQPGVEAYKKNMFRLLGKPGS